jgi:hypothetical protein
VAMYNETGVKKTLLISPEQDSRLKAYCKTNRMSASQLFRLFIDELYVSQYETSLPDNIRTVAFKTHNFVAPTKNIVKEVVNDGNGNILTRWFSRRETANSFPRANHY